MKKFFCFVVFAISLSATANAQSIIETERLSKEVMRFTKEAASVDALSIDSIHLTVTSATFFCSYLNADGSAFARIFWGHNSLDSVSNYHFVSIGDGNFIIQISGLSPSTSYHYFLKITYPFTFDGDSGSFVTQPLITGIQPAVENTMLENQQVSWYSLSGQLITTGSKEDFYNLNLSPAIYIWRDMYGRNGKIFIGH